MSRPNSSMEGDEGGIFIKAQTKNFVFDEDKIKQSVGCSNKEYNVIFEYIHKNTRVFSRNKKSRQ